MSIDFGFFKAKKYKDTTIPEIFRIRAYLDWKNWEGNNYTAEKYLKEFADGKPLPEQDKVDFYEKEYQKTKGIIEPIGYIGGWDNSYIANRTAEELNNVFEQVYDGITEESIKRIEDWLYDELEKHKLTPVYIKEGVKKDKNGEETIVNLSRLIIEDEYYNKKIINISEYTKIFLPGSEYDEEKKEGLERFKIILEKVKDVNLNDYLVWFNIM